MKTVTKYYNFCSLIFCFLLLTQCNKEEENKPPTEVQLVFPTDNLLCISNTVNFEWTTATDPDNDEITYKIEVATDRDFETIIEDRSITQNNISLILNKETAFYWKVTAIDSNDNLGETSPTFAFYTKGDGVQNYAPFSPELIFPENKVVLDASIVELKWTASDVNTTDTLIYELYFGTEGNLTLINDALTEPKYVTNINSGQSYEWQINVKDQKGGKSIGQVWTFKVQ